jgi:hypothetical protein
VYSALSFQILTSIILNVVFEMLKIGDKLKINYFSTKTLTILAFSCITYRAISNKKGNCVFQFEIWGTVNK